MRKLILFAFFSGLILKYSSNAILKYKKNLDDMIRDLNLKLSDIEVDVDNLEKKTITIEENSGKYENIIEKQSSMLVIQRNMIDNELNKIKDNELNKIKDNFNENNEFTEVEKLDSIESKNDKLK